jgi:squalene-associated FAD-dependent desaturase
MPETASAERRVIIVGGGLAGLAAAVGLTRHGVPVTLLESRDRLGGRASSFVDPQSGETLDNCQHVSMGCCTNLLAFNRILGIESKFRTLPELVFIDPDGKRSRLRASRLPAPLHLAPAFARMGFLTLREKLRLALGLRALARLSPSEARDGETFLNWLIRHRQPARIRERFWEVVLVSALSETLDRIDVGYARKVFVDGFLRNRHGWEVSIPDAPLEAIYGQPVLEWLSSRGAEVRLRSGVRRLVVADDRISKAELRNGETVAGDAFVLAIPQHLIAECLPPELAEGRGIRALERMETAPISSLHLWFDRKITEESHAALIGRLSQWLFHRPAEGVGGDGRAPCEAVERYQIVISASRDVERMGREQARDQVLRELSDIWPETTAAKLLHWQLVTERRAVFSATPGVDELRLPQQSEVGNLQFAGDWTRTGWPATMEGAVRSGFAAAENILRRRGDSRKLLAEELSTATLSRWLLGLSD